MTITPDQFGAYRRSQGLTQKQMAALMGVSLGKIRNIEDGKGITAKQIQEAQEIAKMSQYIIIEELKGRKEGQERR